MSETRGMTVEINEEQLPKNPEVGKVFMTKMMGKMVMWEITEVINNEVTSVRFHSMWPDER